MALTDSEILELEQLLYEEKIDRLYDGLVNFNEDTNPNYKFLHNSIKEQTYDKNGELIKGFRGCLLEGSSRSGKTWSGVDIIIWLCTKVETSCTINIYRETYNEFKTTLYEDFKRRLDDFGLDNPFHRAKEIKSFTINKNTIYFLGDGKHGGGCDYAFYNEMMMIPNEVFDQSEMRCRKFWWGDYNPSFTDHYVFDKIVPRPDVGFLRTTFLDNPFISPQERSKILSYEPYLPNSYEVTDDGMYYQGELVTEKNSPPIHPTNIDSGTADEFMWKVYGLGLRGAMKGVIFEHITWIDKFPDIDYIYANDFGFTADPNAFGKYAEDENNIWIEPLIYEPIENPDILAETFNKLGVDHTKPIPCDSSDKYTGENKGTVEMVKGLQERGYPEAYKISKTKSVMYWLLSMKKKKIHVVKNHLWKYVKKERENYKFKEINGILINQPIDKYNHFWDMARYGHIAYNSDSDYTVIWD
ncbi:terminase [Tenacibaculum sp.]|uniref:terminase n=1 Tax=Tenacibaculum sp. TaxID=1906242 RepID=UPI003D098E57